MRQRQQSPPSSFGVREFALAWSRNRVCGEKGGDHLEALRGLVAKLRRKLGDDPKRQRYVIGVRGLGDYMPLSRTTREPPRAGHEPSALVPRARLAIGMARQCQRTVAHRVARRATNMDIQR